MATKATAAKKVRGPVTALPDGIADQFDADTSFQAVSGKALANPFRSKIENAQVNVPYVFPSNIVEDETLFKATVNRIRSACQSLGVAHRILSDANGNKAWMVTGPIVRKPRQPKA